MGRGDASSSAGSAQGRESFELATIRHRSVALGGGISYASDVPGVVNLEAWLPVQNTLAS